MTTSRSTQKLYRISEDSKIAGVCSGLGEYFGMDATWIRIIFVLFFLLGGSALLIYLLMWVIVPLKPKNNDYPIKSVN